MEQVTEQLAVLLIPQLWVRLLCAGICIVLLAFFVNPMLLGIRHAGCYTGIVVCVLGAIFFLFNPQISRVLTIGWHNPHGRIAICIVAGFLTVCVLFAAIVSIGMVRAEDYFPKIEIFLKEIMDQTVEAEKKKLLGNFREFMIHDDIPEPEKGGYKRYIGLGQVFEKYRKFVAEEFDTDGREIDYDDNPTYVPVECRAYIEEAERPKYYISNMEHATLFLVTEDGEDEHGESCNFAIPLNRWNEHDRDGWWIARDAVSIDITDLRHANSMMCYLSKLRANDVLIMDTGECHACVELKNKPEADWN